MNLSPYSKRFTSVPSITSAKQKDWIKAAQKLGLDVNKKGGKGSHVLIINRESSSKYTIQKHLFPIVNTKILKKFLEWGFTEEEIHDALN